LGNRSSTQHLRGSPSGKCAKCRKHVKRLQRDHIIPLSWGGSNDTSNLQDLCGPCHRAKTAAERRMGPPSAVRRSMNRGCLPRGRTLILIIVVMVLILALAG